MTRRPTPKPKATKTAAPQSRAQKLSLGLPGGPETIVAIPGGVVVISRDGEGRYWIRVQRNRRRAGDADGLAGRFGNVRIDMEEGEWTQLEAALMDPRVNSVSFLIEPGVKDG